MFWLHQDKDVSERQQRNTVLIRPRSWVRDSTECILDRTYKIPEKGSLSGTREVVQGAHKKWYVVFKHELDGVGKRRALGEVHKIL